MNSMIHEEILTIHVFFLNEICIKITNFHTKVMFSERVLCFCAWRQNGVHLGHILQAFKTSNFLMKGWTRRFANLFGKGWRQ